MQKTVIACCVGALFAAGTAAAATHEQDGKTGIAGEGSALTVNTQTQNVIYKRPVRVFRCEGPDRRRPVGQPVVVGDHKQVAESSSG